MKNEEIHKRIKNRLLISKNLLIRTGYREYKL